MTTTQTTTAAAPEARDQKPPRLLAFHVSERGGKKYWTRIGAAWDHADGKGLTVQLDLMPASGGRIVLREPSEDTMIEGEGKGA